MKSAPLFLGGASVLTLALLAGCAGTPVGPGNPAAFPTRDVSAVNLACARVSFIVSLNDNDNNRPDLREALAPATNDNVRELVFTHPTADAVFVADIFDLATGRRGFNLTTGWIHANQGQFALFPVYRIDYRLLDQFRRPIHDSAYGTRTPQIRENIGNVMTSPAGARAGLDQQHPAVEPELDRQAGRHLHRPHRGDRHRQEHDRRALPGQSRPPDVRPRAPERGRRPAPADRAPLLAALRQRRGRRGRTANTFTSSVSAVRPQGGGRQLQFTSTYRANPR